MPRTLTAQDSKSQKPSFQELWQPVENIHRTTSRYCNLSGISTLKNDF